jgi:hypothetical protein
LTLLLPAFSPRILPDRPIGVQSPLKNDHQSLHKICFSLHSPATLGAIALLLNESVNISKDLSEWNPVEAVGGESACISMGTAVKHCPHTKGQTDLPSGPMTARRDEHRQSSGRRQVQFTSNSSSFTSIMLSGRPGETTSDKHPER